ncbi:bifunctional diaminohydroxyphosphoribosylaminopyrimidine deaminase/5-amino-6-(5-phosphoribosylamino)uracil reductase RibD [Sphingobacterium lumbrici]|uniref:bifunctional diaminohydroxyphosphoribosylaminopyrimidine deaminase/5-amino-6-(5-phosphoribosylamino)uracil reductase RibD n=1 Tax=Sphingobacterium lumbrici TaxID=2559600 RepID=UPI001127EF3F|nr:bifunctional diaminohydroxyphosphoribosylaminopyrimidine deaminase/5-amino-6-(5-phosphoribosylamino)uracil reductase RibD [Sphingobacterium lumbrici]
MDRREYYMQRCLDLAVLGMGTVSPNPMVGAVVVHEDAIIGEGYTSPCGGPHAEVNAVQSVITKYGIEKANQLLADSTIYVSLEPCAHFGKTPPCADMLIAHGLQKVVIGCLDPFSKVNGLGIAKLLSAGIEVVKGVLEDECQYINRRFFTQINKNRPYVVLKWAETNDGYFAPDDDRQQWISNAASKQLVHKWRSEEDAILVGKNTALIDNPSLTNRCWTGKSPKRILIDRNLDVPADYHLLDQSIETIVFNAVKSEWNQNLKYIEIENFDLYLPQNILYQLYLMDVQSIIIEGGAKTLQMFIDAGLWDEARIFVSKESWGAGMVSPKISGVLEKKLQVSDDQLLIYHPIN